VNEIFRIKHSGHANNKMSNFKLISDKLHSPLGVGGSSLGNHSASKPFASSESRQQPSALQ